MRHWRKCLAGIVLVIALTSAVQYLEVARNENYRNLLIMAKKSHQQQMPVDLTLRILDQFGAPAIHYPIKVGLHYAHWYYWVFPLWGMGQKCYMVDTDEQGIARLHPWCQSASHTNFRQVDLFRYDFPRGKQCDHCQNYEENPWGVFSLPNEGGKKQEMVLHVLKHDPPAKLKGLDIQYADRPDSLLVAAQDEHVLTLSLAKGRLFDGATEGDIVLLIKNAREAQRAFYSQEHVKPESSDKLSTLSVELEGQKGWELARAPEDYLTYAPESGYQQVLQYSMPLQYSEMEKQVFMKNRHSACYYLMSVYISLERAKIVRVSVRVCYNPDGTRNFYRQTRPDDEIQRNKQLCR